MKGRDLRTRGRLFVPICRKVSYGNQTSKYYELLSRQYAAAGRLPGGPANGAASRRFRGWANAADLDALRQAVSAEADNPCGAGGVCQPLTIRPSSWHRRLSLHPA